MKRHLMKRQMSELQDNIKALSNEKSALETMLHHAQKMETLGLIAGRVTHDIQSLTSDMLVLADRTLKDIPSHTPTYRSMEELKLSILRIKEISEHLLTFGGKSQHHDVDIDISALVSDMKPLLKSAIPEHTKLTFDLPDGLPLIKSEAGKLRQVVMNLVSNASDAGNGTDDVITLTTGVKTYRDTDFAQLSGDPDARLFPCKHLVPAPFVYLEVSDTGCGMDAEHLARIFNPYYTTKNGHSGLGLTVVFGTVHEHGGALIVRTRTGKGAQFRALFPTVKKQEST